MEPVENTAPSLGYSKKTMSARTSGLVVPVWSEFICITSSTT